jgi:hypothetical protein
VLAHVKRLKGEITMTMKKKMAAVMEYAQQTWETPNENIKTKFRVQSVQPISADTFKISLIYAEGSTVEDIKSSMSFVDEVMCFTFSTDGEARANYSYSNKYSPLFA